MGVPPGGFGGSPGLDHGQLLTAEEQGRHKEQDIQRQLRDPNHRPPKRPSWLRRMFNRILRRRDGEA